MNHLAIVLVGFVLRLRPTLVVVIAAIVTGLIAKLSLVENLPDHRKGLRRRVGLMTQFAQ